LNGERIDIVRWNDSLQVLIPNALQPAAIADVFTYPRLGRAIVLVDEDQLSLAIGRRGQNVRLASKLVGLDLEIMTHDELGEALERAERWFRILPHIQEEHVQSMIEEGFLSYNELTFIDGEELLKFTNLTPEQADEVIQYAEDNARVMEASVEEERRAAEEAAEAERQASAAEAARQAEEAAGANPEAETVSEEAVPEPEADSPSEAAPGEDATMEREDTIPETEVAVAVSVAEGNDGATA